MTNCIPVKIDIPPMPSLLELLIPSGQVITSKVNSKYYKNGEGKKMGYRKCTKCGDTYPKGEMYHRPKSAADYLFCPKCAPAQIARDKKKYG